MKEEILEKIKKAYFEKVGDLERGISIKKRLLELEQDKTVKEYLSLLEEYQSIDYQKLSKVDYNRLISKAFYRYAHEIKETNEIYVYLGTYISANYCDIEHGTNDYRVKRNNPKAEYCLYKDLESCETIHLPIHLCEEFENNNKIIYPNTHLTDRAYYQLQDTFIKDACFYGQEQAILNIMGNSITKVNLDIITNLVTNLDKLNLSKEEQIELMETYYQGHAQCKANGFTNKEIDIHYKVHLLNYIRKNNLFPIKVKSKKKEF